MGVIKELMSSYNDAHGCYPESADELYYWNMQRENDRARAEYHESMKGGDRPTTALVAITAPFVVLALVAIILL